MAILDGSAGTGNSGGSSNQGGQGTQGAASGGQSGTGAAGQAGGSGAAAGGAQPSWRDSLPDDIKGNPALQTFTDVGTLAKSYLHAQSLVGKKGVFVPEANAAEDDWKAFFKSVGQPDADKFELKAPQGKQMDPAFSGKFKEWAHGRGLLPRQAQGLLEDYMAYEEASGVETKKVLADKAAEEVKKLQQEWGDGYEKQVKLSLLGMKEGMGRLAPDVQAWVDKRGLGDDPMMIKIFNQLGKLTGEDKLRGDGAGKFGQTPDELEQEEKIIRADPNFGKGNAQSKILNDRLSAVSMKRWK